MSRKGELPDGQPANAIQRDGAPPGYSEMPQAPPLQSASRHLPPRPSALTSTPGLPLIDLSQYSIPSATISKDEKTLTVFRPDLCNNVDALTNFLRAQAALPPRPQIRITGVHDLHGERKVDFSIRVNLMRYIIPPHGHPPLNYVKVSELHESPLRKGSTTAAAPHIDGGLKEWARRFCRDKTANKAFILERTVPNWNTTLLEGSIRTVLASLNYKGHVTVDFPVTHSTVVVTNKPPNQGFFPRLLSLLASTKQYAVAQSVWPYANIAASGTAEEGGATHRVCVVQNEVEWWDVWRNALVAAMMEGRQGWVTLEDVMDYVMTGKPGVHAKKPWG